MPSNRSNLLDSLNSVSESSLSGVFQEFFSKGFNNNKSTARTTSAEPLQFGDVEGSDFKRLLHKNTVKRQDELPSLKNNNKKAHRHHQNSLDFRPVLILDNPTTTLDSINSSHSSGSSTFGGGSRFGSAFYSLFFQHKDRYFRNDRDELSKDIFPAEKTQGY